KSSARTPVQITLRTGGTSGADSAECRAPSLRGESVDASPARGPFGRGLTRRKLVSRTGRLQTLATTKRGISLARDGYDIITVGGGLGGAALAKSMAEHGARVLVLEREKRFKDRIRGEFMAPWGVAEAQALGIDGLLRATCARECPRFGFYTEPEFG